MQRCSPPKASLRRQARAGLIIGFAIDDAAIKAEFESWAQRGGGSYFDAAGLQGALVRAAAPG